MTSPNVAPTVCWEYASLAAGIDKTKAAKPSQIEVLGLSRREFT